MSDRNLARRTEAAISFDGADITKDIKPYFLSLTYTDNEEDEADDLQIQLQDRDEVWLTKWLADMVSASASGSASQTPATPPPAPTYKVGDVVQFLGGPHYSNANAATPPNSPGPGKAKITIIYQLGKSKHPYHVIHTDRSSYVYGWVDETSIAPLDAAPETQASTPVACSAMKISASIVRQNWDGDGKDTLLECGAFELDSIVENGPPSTVTIKANSLPFSSQIRQTKISKAWESYHLSGIAKEMAKQNGMTCLYSAASDPYYARVEQYKVSDIDFLSKLCHDAGISLKATNNIVVLFDQAEYEKKSAVRTITKGDGTYTKYKLNTGTADTQYASCRVSYVNGKGQCISAIATVADYKADAKNNQQLEISAKVESVAEAKALAAKCLRLHNKYENTVTFTLPGNPSLVAGVTVMLKGWGLWNGKYIIKQAKHTVNGNGYTTQITLRKVLEGY